MTEYQDNKEKFLNLRKEFPVFSFDNFTFCKDGRGLVFQFFFSCNEHKFSPTQVFENKDFYTDDLSEKQLSLLAFNLGMIEMLSYWKAFCSPVIQILCGGLSVEQEVFWKKLYLNGLGEFFYLNNLLDCRENLFRFESKGKILTKEKFDLKEEFLVPIGGGKDSVCSLELLRGKGKKITPLVINLRGATKDCIERAGFSLESSFTIKRSIDKHLLELNAEGFLNGHTPFSAMLAFSCLIASALTKKKYIALSNENSANESTVSSMEINHQYSKSIEFENDFRAYCKQFIGEDFEYFSLLRPISELRIAKIFSQLPYKDVFKSCNAGSKTDIWCGHCPKCLFAFIILSPFISVKELENIFGKNLFEDMSLLKEFKELTGESEVKPFECVGTVEEVNIALALRIRSEKASEKEVLLKYWEDSALGKHYLKGNFGKALNFESSENNIPNDLKDIFKKEYLTLKKASLVRSWQNKRITIMGLGREGKSTYKFLKNLFPDKPIILFDKNKQAFEGMETGNDICFFSQDDYATINQNSDIIFLAPGIALKELHDIEHVKITNQCDIFLQLFKEQSIGISGTKGKSTTSTLLFETIKKQYSNTVLAGNIGIPFFDISENIDDHTIIVLELSCHQLQHIKKAPHISVLLNLYEEHLDHYTSYEDYQLSKLNLLSKGEENDIFIYNRESLETERWVRKFNLKRRYKTFAQKDYIFDNPKYLKGEHNKLNILAVLNAAEELPINREECLNTCINFKGLPHRLQFVAEKNGVSYYNDSISTIPQATLAAVNSLNNVSVLILGGMDRGIDYLPLRELVSKYGIKHIIFVGKAGKRMFDILIKENENLDYLISDDWNLIVRWASQKAEKNSSVLLSPAASSYDQFKNFEYRGKCFEDLVFSL
ncbi:MAG: UDP-N-acetylmuramoyl-L-alanine--D-glutamate ligase [Bacteroidales bacterium]|nr:UDP-N-acetylmuramoyl-L-alanine--D-glutamate ligase [Bacteroidales bacterium]